jgi:MFS family permease
MDNYCPDRRIRYDLDHLLRRGYAVGHHGYSQSLCHLRLRQHSLTPTVGILSSVIGGVTNLTLAKVLDVFGRPQGFLLCIILATSGLIMMAACNNVEAYAAAQVFYTLGNNGLQYSLSIFVADTSSLRN